MDKSFSEQQIRIVDTKYILCEKNWTRTHSGTRSYSRQAGRQVADEIQVNFEILKITVHRKIRLLAHLTKAQHHYNSKNASYMSFRVKSIVKLVF